MERCDPDSSIAELTDFICAAQMAKAVDALLPITQRTIPEDAIGPPYFYYENMTLAPIGVWTEMSRYLYDVEPEFVDSKYFCTAAWKRGYIHNLPIENIFLLIPLPLYTIHDAFPLTKKLVAFLGSKNKVELFTNMYKKCQIDRKDLNKVVSLEPDEVEMLLGFPKNHTRGGGSARDMFPGGINILSLLSKISDAEVAFYCLGIPLKTDAQELNSDWLEQLMSRFCELDLVVDGIQCNNLTERNKHHQDELEDFCWCISYNGCYNNFLFCNPKIRTAISHSSQTIERFS
ncbi:hypothetical protein F3Y22_tig00111877pilonHSYRG00446 [Hibiscus syriacus]|uniref:SAM-dependent MTase DRM-type domain-containing protein n=1 Tax=Hibiscus syriacus TaxID=106335 RepID=A0A6A2YDW7_HIBSY|nr:hypothetical protein F3Y22_tig00111877pilonHSYRG00446 [Hibiscus syriacus]